MKPPVTAITALVGLIIATSFVCAQEPTKKPSFVEGIMKTYKSPLDRPATPAPSTARRAATPAPAIVRQPSTPTPSIERDGKRDVLVLVPPQVKEFAEQLPANTWNIHHAAQTGTGSKQGMVLQDPRVRVQVVNTPSLLDLRDFQGARYIVQLGQIQIQPKKKWRIPIRMSFHPDDASQPILLTEGIIEVNAWQPGNKVVQTTSSSNGMLNGLASRVVVADGQRLPKMSRDDVRFPVLFDGALAQVDFSNRLPVPVRAVFDLDLSFQTSSAIHAYLSGDVHSLLLDPAERKTVEVSVVNNLGVVLPKQLWMQVIRIEIWDLEVASAQPLRH